jgi:FADH2-dependent halogenase
MLDKAKALGAQFLQGKAKAVRLEGDAVRGVYMATSAAEQIEIASKVVVDASGQATFLHRMGTTSSKYRGEYDKQLAVYSQISGGIRSEGAEPDNTLILYKSRNHWAWFIPLSDKCVSVGVVVPSAYYGSKNESLEEFFRREVYEINPELKRRLPSLELLEKVRGSSNYSYAIDQYVGDGFLCVGDAHRFIDPVFSFGVHLAIHEAELAASAIAKHLSSNEPMGKGTFSEYQRMCDIGMNTIQELVDAFWNSPHAFAHAAHHKHKEEMVDLFAGRIYTEKPSRGLIALQRINQAYREKLGDVANDRHN